MKMWHKWIVPLIMVCTVQVGLANAEEKAETPAVDAQIAEELAAALADLEGGILTTDARTQRIALLVARITQLAPDYRLAILGDFSRQVSTADLGVVSAAAVMAAGSSSPVVLQTMVDAQGSDASRTQALHQGATNPTLTLGTQVASMIQPVELQASPVAVATPAQPRVAAPAPVAVNATLVSEFAASTDIQQVDPIVSAATPQPPPPQPPGLPPRPPALPYRGQ